MRDSSTKWLVALFAAILFAGAVVAVVLVFHDEYRIQRVGQIFSDGKSPEDRSRAKSYALRALQRHGIRSLAQECSADYIDGQWLVAGKAIDRDNRIAEVAVLFRVATVGKTTRWELVRGEVDGAEFGP